MTSPRGPTWPVTFARRIAAAKWLIIGAWLVVLGVAFVGQEKVVHDPDVLVYFDGNRAERKAFDAIARDFGHTNEVVTLVVPEDDNALSPAALRALGKVSVQAAAQDQTAAVRSILTVAGVDPFEVATASDAALSELAGIIAAAVAAAPEEAAPVLASDNTVAAVAAIIPRAQNDAAVRDIAATHRAIKENVAAAVPGVALLQTGRIVIDDAFQKEGQDDAKGYFSTQLMILSALVFAAVGSVSLVITMVVIVFAIVFFTLGGVGWSGIPVNGISSAAPAVLMGLAVASTIHIVMSWQVALRKGAGRIQALAIAYHRNARPVAVSILTTAVSFLLLNVAESPPFRQLGNTVAFGLVGVLALSFTFLPALLMIIPRSTASHRIGFDRAMGRLGALVVARRIPLLGAATAVAIAALAGISTITVDDTFSHYFDERYEVRQATDLFEEKLSGTTIVDIAVDTGTEGGALTPDMLAGSERLTTWLYARPEVARIASLATVAASAGPGADAATLVRVHEEMAASGVPVLLDGQARRLRLQVVMRGVGSRDTLAFADMARVAAADAFPSATVAVTGMPILSARLSVESAKSMVVGMVLALGAISVIIGLTLGSVRLGLISLLPNLLPVSIAFGIWGFVSGEVSFAATVVGALTYGIVVDDTVHFLAKYQRFRQTLGLSIVDAVRASFQSVGVAVVVTSLAIGLSFLPFAMSGFLVNAHFGALTAMTLMAALVADLFFLPALLAASEPSAAKRKRVANAPSPAE
ncbi:MAG: MMPL family transporter [Devosia sp.]